MPRYLSSADGSDEKTSRKKHGSGRKSQTQTTTAGRRSSSKDVGDSSSSKKLKPKDVAASVDNRSERNYADDVSEIRSETSRMSFDNDEDQDDVLSVTAESVVGPGGEITEDHPALLQGKIKENIDNASDKNTKIRTAALKNLESILSKNYAPDYLENWKDTLSYCVDNLMRKGTSSDRRSAVKIAALLALQLGQLASTEAFRTIITTLKSLTLDPSLSEEYRAECSTTLAICTFVAEEETEDILNVLQTLYAAWAHVKVHSTTEAAPLFASAVAGWSLILLQAPTRHLEQVLNTELPKLCGFLESPHVEMRIAAGEGLAFLYEMASDIFSEFRPPSHHNTLDHLERLSKESQKFHTKKERRLQRASFREIYSAIKDGETPQIAVKFGAETLNIDSWWSKLCYDIFCQVLAGGTNVNLKENLFIRNVFNLGAPLPTGVSYQRLSKSERQSLVNTISKARTLVRGKQRDKRTATFN